MPRFDGCFLQPKGDVGGSDEAALFPFLSNLVKRVIPPVMDAPEVVILGETLEKLVEHFLRREALPYPAVGAQTSLLTCCGDGIKNVLKKFRQLFEWQLFGHRWVNRFGGILVRFNLHSFSFGSVCIQMASLFPAAALSRRIHVRTELTPSAPAFR